MGGIKTDPSLARMQGGHDAGWPVWARCLASAALGIHLAALLAAALAAPPSSDLERAAADLFAPYLQLIDQGYAYRYYAPEPGPTPVVTARLRFEDGREESVRLPTRGLLPRLRYQRQLALANHLANDYGQARAATGSGRNSVWARSYARHLARTRGGRGCVSVVLSVQWHLAPEPERVAEQTSQSGRVVDLDAEEFYTAPERIGEYSCDGF